MITFVAACRLKGSSSVESSACHPGQVSSDILRKADHDKLSSVATDWAQGLSAQTTESGALPLLYSALLHQSWKVGEARTSMHARRSVV